MRVDEEIESWTVITNSDLTEGKGGKVVLHHCESRSTAVRLAKGKGVQGSNAQICDGVLFKIDGLWYGEVIPKQQTTEDHTLDIEREKYREAKRKAEAAGLTSDEIKLLQNNYEN